MSPKDIRVLQAAYRRYARYWDLPTAEQRWGLPEPKPRLKNSSVGKKSLKRAKDRRTMIPVQPTVRCPKGFLTQQRGIWAWGRLSKKKKLVTNVQQCPLCSKWHLGTDAQIVARENLIKKLAQLREHRRAETEKAETFEKRLKQPAPKRIVHGQPIGTITVAAPKRKFAKRPRRGAMALAKATMQQAKPEWAITAEQREGWAMLRALAVSDKPLRGQALLAAQKLGPFAKLPIWLQLELLKTGVALPRTKYGRIPLGDALTWETKRSKATTRKSKKDVARYSRRKPKPEPFDFQRYITSGPTHKTLTFYDSLRGYAINRYGGTNGPEYAQTTAA